MATANHRWRKFENGLMQVITCVCALLVITPLVLVFYHLIKEGFGSVNWAFFSQLPKPVGEVGGGMANSIVGTLILLAIAAAIGVPVGVFGGGIRFRIRFLAVEPVDTFRGGRAQRRALHHLGRGGLCPR